MMVPFKVNVYLTPAEMAIIKSLQINAGKGVEKKEYSCTVGGFFDDSHFGWCEVYINFKRHHHPLMEIELQA